MYMLDTDICIYIINKKTIKLAKKIASVPAESICISTITQAELEYGVYVNSSYEQNRNKLLSFIKLVDILQFDESAAMQYGIIRADLKRINRKIGPIDMLIAAHAISTKRILATNNERDFRKIDRLVIENWIK